MTKQEMADLLEEALTLVSHHPNTAQLVERIQQAIKETRAERVPRKSRQSTGGG